VGNALFEPILQCVSRYTATHLIIIVIMDLVKMAKHIIKFLHHLSSIRYTAVINIFSICKSTVTKVACMIVICWRW